MTQDLESEHSLLDCIDPAWDYLAIFKELLKLRDESEITIAFIKDQENATPSSHAQLAMHSEKIANILQSIQEKLR